MPDRSRRESGDASFDFRLRMSQTFNRLRCINLWEHAKASFSKYLLAETKPYFNLSGQVMLALTETCIGVIISKPELETWEFTSKCGQVSDHAARSDITLLFVSLLLVLAQHVRLRNTLTRILH